MKVFFQFPEEGTPYMDDFLPLAEGLSGLGINFYANRNYWLSGPEANFLFSKCCIEQPCSGDVVVHSYRSFQYYDDSERLIHASMLWLQSLRKECINILIDHEDGYQTAATKYYRCFDMVFRSKVNARAFFEPNVVPWALAFSNRVIDATKTDIRFPERKNMLLLNFGASHGYEHGTRNLFTGPFLQAVGGRLVVDRTKDDLRIPPESRYDHLMWEQTQRRHSKTYYERLKSTQSIATFCGEMIPPAPKCPSYLVGGGRAKLKRRFYEALEIFDTRPPRSIQWDSWRFWEGLAAGCLVFNIDLDYYGVELPVMPVNGVHYVGLRIDRMQEGVDEILNNPERMAAIARQGREWAMEHYSPVAMAKRFLQIVESGVIGKRP